jgi:hypothetical protein
MIHQIKKFKSCSLRASYFEFDFIYIKILQSYKIQIYIEYHYKI